MSLEIPTLVNKIEGLNVSFTRVKMYKNVFIILLHFAWKWYSTFQHISASSFYPFLGPIKKV
jgi:hypothetical protein